MTTVTTIPVVLAVSSVPWTTTPEVATVQQPSTATQAAAGTSRGVRARNPSPSRAALPDMRITRDQGSLPGPSSTATATSSSPGTSTLM